MAQHSRGEAKPECDLPDCRARVLGTLIHYPNQYHHSTGADIGLINDALKIFKELKFLCKLHWYKWQSRKVGLIKKNEDFLRIYL